MNEKRSNRKTRKPLIGLVLGSGSARGWAHIGVIRELETLGIRPDIIAGCSVGAVVGGACAAGVLDDFEQWVLTLDKVSVVRLLDSGLFRGGVIRGDTLMETLSSRFGNPDIESLDIPYGCVATELDSGREVWLRSGRLRDAVRASIALPGVFTPMKFNGSWLLDGGLVNPVPVSLARAMGADVIIAVNLNGDLLGSSYLQDRANTAVIQEPATDDKESPSRHWADRLKRSMVRKFERYLDAFQSDEEPEPGLFDVMLGAIDIMQDRVTRSRMAGEPADILITPRIRDISLMDFHRAEEAIQAGRDAARRQRWELESLAAALK